MTGHTLISWANRHVSSSSVAYHNGTIITLASIGGSDEFRNLMWTALGSQNIYEPQSATISCPDRVWDTKPKSEKDMLRPMRSYGAALRERIKDAFRSPQPPDPIPSLDANEQMIQAQLLALEPFVDMNAEARSQVTVAIQIPPWLVASRLACKFLKAAEATFGRVGGFESVSSSTYTALGHELCRVAHEAYRCDGPGRLATLEYDGYLAVASIIKTPIGIFDHMWTKYSVLTSSNPAELSKWINSFLDACSPDMIALAGSGVGLSIFQQALELSNAVGRTEMDDAVKPEDIIVQGAAEVAKDYLETRDTDCSEFDECLDIHCEADRIAGEYQFRRPKIWPAVNNRHWRTDYDIPLRSVRFETAGQYIYEELL